MTRMETPLFKAERIPVDLVAGMHLYLTGNNGGRDRTRTCDLLRVKQAL